MRRGDRAAGESATRKESAAEQVIAEQVLATLLTRIDELVSLDDRGYFDLEDGSALALDDAAVRPLQVSLGPRLSLLAAIDHLRTVSVLVRAGDMPMMAMGTLLRSAIENASNALFLAHPDDRGLRITLALQDAWSEISEKEKSLADFAPDVEFDRDKEEELVRRAAGAVPGGISMEVVRKRPPGATARARAAGPIVETHLPRGRLPGMVVGLWSSLSGLTHGRPYAALRILDREELSYDDASGVVMTHMTFGATTLAGVLAVVLDVLDAALHVYAVRARAYTRSLADTEFEQILRQERLLRGPSEA